MQVGHRRTLWQLFLFALIMALCAAPVMAAEGAIHAPKAGEPAPVSIQLNASSKVLAFDAANRSFELRIERASYGGDTHYGIPQQVEWRTGSNLVILSVDPADPSRCTVSVAGSQVGICSVEAWCGSASAGCKIEVVRAIKARKISLNRRTATLYIGSDGAKDTLQLTPTLSPANASAADPGMGLLRWSSSKPSRAAVDETGLVTPKNPGTVTIRGVLTDGSKKKVSCKVTVKPVKPGSISVSPMNLSVGERQPIGAIIRPDDALDKRIGYVSSNPKVAKVAKDGTVTGVKPGKAVITCTTKSGKRKAKCSVTVTKEAASTQIAQSSPGSPGSGGSANTSPRHFFYGIGNANYPAFSLPSAAGDVGRMGALYAAARFSGASVKTSTRTNLSADGIRQLLKDMASQNGAGQNDVSIFYYSGIAVPPRDGESGKLMGSDGECVGVDELRSLLDQVPGTIVVILECPVPILGFEGASSGAMAFGQSVVASFAGSRAANYAPGAKALSGGTASKYKLLAACGPNGDAMTMGAGASSYGLFTGAIDLVLTQATEPVTLDALYRAVQGEIDATLAPASMSQSVCVWPLGDATVVYSKN